MNKYLYIANNSYVLVVSGCWHDDFKSPFIDISISLTNMSTMEESRRVTREQITKPVLKYVTNNNNNTVLGNGKLYDYHIDTTQDKLHTNAHSLSDTQPGKHYTSSYADGYLRQNGTVSNKKKHAAFSSIAVASSVNSSTERTNGHFGANYGRTAQAIPLFNSQDVKAAQIQVCLNLIYRV